MTAGLPDSELFGDDSELPSLRGLVEENEEVTAELKSFPAIL
jgi:hypothetical protein